MSCATGRLAHGLHGFVSVRVSILAETTAGEVDVYPFRELPDAERFLAAVGDEEAVTYARLTLIDDDRAVRSRVHTEGGWADSTVSI